MSVHEGKMSVRELAPVAAFVAGSILGVPVIAFIVFKDHPYWATAGGLLLGCILAYVLVSVLFAYHEIITDEEKAKSDQKTRVREAVRTGDAVEIAIVNMQKLDEYYALNRNQALYSFFASIVAVCVGFAAILIAARFATDTKQVIAGALAGVLLNFIGGGFFVMYNKSLQQLNLFYGKLVQLQDTMLAVQQCDKLPDAKAAEAREKIILELVTRPVQNNEAGMPRSEASKSRGRASTKAARVHRGEGESVGADRQKEGVAA
jgi:hypothetical protein